MEPKAITFLLDLWGPERERRRSEGVLRLLIEVLITVNLGYLRSHRNKVPFLYSSGVRYMREPRGVECFQDIPTTILLGSGDCEDLAAWRCAELRFLGYDAHPFISLRRNGNYLLYHIRVRWPDGSIEDPSALLGMGADDHGRYSIPIGA